MKYNFILLYTFISFIAHATNDSLIHKNDLKFKNPEERAAFSTQYFNETESIIDILLISFEKENIADARKVKQDINDCVNTLKKEIDGKNETKKIKIIYDFVHKKFLKVYKLENSFSDIFSKGEYNCVSASALYAIILSKLNIPYTAIEAPQHVYLVAYPQSFKILIETTSPENGYFQFNDAFINKYIKSLYQAKLISKTEYENNSSTSLFDKYYFNSKGLNLKELASLQYSNYAAYNFENKKYTEANEEIKKAYFLNNYERNKYILKLSLLYLVQDNKYETSDQVTALALLCRFNDQNDEELSNNNLKNEFVRLTETQLINNSNYDMYDKSYNTIKKEIKDTTLHNEIAFVYHYELSRLGYMNNKDTTYEMPHLRSAYKMNPKNANLQSIILSYTERIIKLEENPKTVLNIMKTNADQFQFLSENNLYNGVRANCILELAYQCFAINDIPKGENYLKEFESLMNEKKDTKANENFIEKAYAFAAGIYYKKGNVAKSKQTLKTGLIYAPGNFGLTLRLNQL